VSWRCVVASLLLALAAASGTAGAQPAAERLSAPLAGAGRVVFLGDSITYAATYVEYVEAAARLRDPAWPADILALGLPSETVSGLSEPCHAEGRFPRPDQLLSDAWLTATGHSRPGMAPGVPLDEARARAAELDARIRALLQRR
jgi:hypothetical protein